MDGTLLNSKHTISDTFFKLFNDLKYNIFLPNKSHSTNNAGYMIHSHLSSVLSSYVFYGQGYHSIIFNRDVTDFNDNYAQLKIKRDFFHSKGDINIIDSAIK
ncbi:hypothetical protein [Lacinutrix sp.]|uniref:hypothetical protein n=1 Tax=Lacinutrix sp. TaxID=1937692 RepID=UPI0030EE5B25